MVVRFSLKLTLKMNQKDYKPPAFPMYVKDWLTGKWVTKASDTEIRVYLQLLCLMWLENDTALENDSEYLAKICYTDVKIIERIITNKLKINGLKIFDKKLKGIKEEMRAKHDLRVKAGQKGGLIKSKQCLSNAQAKGVAKEDEDEDAIEIEYNKGISINTIGEFFEKNIRALTPHICQELELLEKEHKEKNVLKAMAIAVEGEKTNIRYIKGILDNEKQNNYKWEKFKQKDEDPYLSKLPFAIKKQVQMKIEQFQQNTGRYPKEGNIKIMIEKITHEKVK